MKRCALYFAMSSILVAGCSDSEIDAPELTVEYLAGGWDESQEACDSDDGPKMVFSSAGELLAEEEAFPFTIQGRKMTVELWDGETVSQELQPIDQDNLRLQGEGSSDWQPLVRCAEGRSSRPDDTTASDKTTKLQSSTEANEDSADPRLTGPEIDRTSSYTVTVSCSDLNGRFRLPLSACFTDANGGGRMGYVDAQKSREYSSMELMTMSMPEEQIYLAAPFTFYVQSFTNTPTMLIATLRNAHGKVIDEKQATGIDTILLRGEPPARSALGNVTPEEANKAADEAEKAADEAINALADAIKDLEMAD